MDAQQMAELIVSLLGGEGGRKRVGEFGRGYTSKNFGTKSVVCKIESVYIGCSKQYGC